MLQKKIPDDYVISSGRQYSVKDFVNKVCLYLNLKINWIGKGLSERGIVNKKVFIEVNKDYFRPAEVDQLIGDSSKAYKILGWRNKTSIEKLIKDMCDKVIEKINK
jgi:GDPmannose 4,6-dehydratase